MSAINDLIEQIPNPGLRFKIRKEVDRMTKQKKYRGFQDRFVLLANK